MGQIVTVEGSIPEDFPQGITKPQVQKEALEVIRKRLGLREQDKVIIKVRGR